MPYMSFKDFSVNLLKSTAGGWSYLLKTYDVLVQEFAMIDDFPLCVFWQARSSLPFHHFDCHHLLCFPIAHQPHGSIPSTAQLPYLHKNWNISWEWQSSWPAATAEGTLHQSNFNLVGRALSVPQGFWLCNLVQYRQIGEIRCQIMLDIKTLDRTQGITTSKRGGYSLFSGLSTWKTCCWLKYLLLGQRDSPARKLRHHTHELSAAPL